MNHADSMPNKAGWKLRVGVAAASLIVLMLAQGLLPRPASLPGYPERVPTQLRQAKWDWGHRHDPVRLMKQVRHSLFPVFDRRKR